MELVTTREDYDSISWSTRMFVAREMHLLLQELKPYVDGSLGEVAAGHVQAFVRVAHELAALFEGHKRPFEEKEAGIPAARVEQMLADQEARFELQLEQAVRTAEAAVELRVRAEVAAVERLSLEQGRDAVLRQLQQVASR